VHAFYHTHARLKSSKIVPKARHFPIKTRFLKRRVRSGRADFPWIATGWAIEELAGAVQKSGLNSDGERSAYNSIQNPHREVFLAPDTLNRLAVHRPSRTGGNMNKLFHLAVWAVNHISNERHVRHRRMLSLKRRPLFYRVHRLSTHHLRSTLIRRSLKRSIFHQELASWREVDLPHPINQMAARRICE